MTIPHFFFPQSSLSWDQLPEQDQDKFWQDLPQPPLELHQSLSDFPGEKELMLPESLVPFLEVSRVDRVATGCLETHSPPKSPAKAVSASGTEIPQPDLLMAQGDVMTEGCAESVVNAQEVGSTPPQDSASIEEAIALNILGLGYYYSRNGRPQDYQQTIEIFTTAANSGNAPAKCNLACCYVLAGKKNAAIRLLKEASQDGFTPAKNYLAIRWLLGWDNGKKSFTYGSRYFKEAVTLLKEGAKQNDRMCTLNLATCYEFGIGVPCDQAECARLRKVAQTLSPHKDRDNLIGEILYQLTEDQARDIKKAVRSRYELCLTKRMVKKIATGASVAERSLQLTQTLIPPRPLLLLSQEQFLGNYQSLQGPGSCEKPLSEVAQQSANHVDQVARSCFEDDLSLSEYTSGKNMSQSTFQLPPICETVALGARVEAYLPVFLIKLGVAYQSGIDGMKDSEKAVNAFLKAGGLGSLEQLYILGMVYMAGIGCVQDPTLAFIIFSAGADLGDPICTEIYWRCCAHGIGMSHSSNDPSSFLHRCFIRRQ